MRRICHLILAFTLFSCLLVPLPASANSAEPPCLTVYVTGSPSDLELSLQFPDGSIETGIPLEKERRGWESTYRFFYHSSPGSWDKSPSEWSGTVLAAEWGGGSFQCELPWAVFETYNNVITLDMESQSVALGQPPWRTPLLVALRVGLTLLIEGLLFFLAGYRKRNSWGLFLVTNLVTQTLLNLLLTGPMMYSYWFLPFALGEVLVLAAELLVFLPRLTEKGKVRAALFTLIANGASLLLGGLLLSYLPL